MTREHLAPSSSRGPVRTGLGVIALAAALAMATSACQSSSSKASVVGQDPTTSSAAVGAPSSDASSSGAAPAKASDNGGDAASTAPAAAGGFKVGQQVKVGAFTVTVHKVSYPYSNDMDQPDDGKAYVLLDVEVANSGSESQAFSSLMQFGLKDSTNATYDETIMLGADGNPPDGDIAVGKSLRGPVGFEVPAGAKGLQFSFLPTLDGEKTYIDLGK